MFFGDFPTSLSPVAAGGTRRGKDSSKRLSPPEGMGSEVTALPGVDLWIESEPLLVKTVASLASASTWSLQVY